MLQRIASRWVVGIGLGLALAACGSSGGDNRTSGETAGGGGENSNPGVADAGGGTDAGTMSTGTMGTGTDAGGGGSTDAGATGSTDGMLAGFDCNHAITLSAGTTLSHESTLRGGEPNTLCLPSDAAQRFYTFQLPARMRATVTVTATTMFTPVARVMVSCTATECLTDDQANRPGGTATVVVDSPGDETVTKIVTVSGLDDKDGGNYSISLSLNPMDGSTGGMTGGGDADGGMTGDTDAGMTDGGTTTSTAGAPRAIAPLSTSTVTSRRPTFHWTLAAGTTGAQVELCADRGCTTSEGMFTATGAFGAPSFDLSPGVHFWRLRGIDATGVGSATSATWEFFVGARSAAVDTSWGTTPDYNGDGSPDLVTGGAEMLTDNTTYNAHAFVYGNTGNGLPTAPTYQLEYPGRLFVLVSNLGDVNGDGFGDLAVTYMDRVTQSMSTDVYYGGSGALSAASMTTLTEAQAIVMAWGVVPAGDVNGDGYADVVVADRSNIALLYGGPMGLIATNRQEVPALRTGDSWSAPRFVPAGDVNGDGFADVVAWYYNEDGGGSLVYVLDGSPAGLSSVATSLGGYEFVPAIAATDVNGDGFADVGVSSPGAGAFSIFLGGAAGVSATPASRFTNAGFPPNGLAVAGDFDGDGYGDFVVKHRNASTGGNDIYFEVLHGGAGGLTMLEDLAYPYVRANFDPTEAFTVGDVNHDGIAELILSGATNDVQQIEVLSGTSSGPSMTPSETLTWPSPEPYPYSTRVDSFAGAR